MSTTLEWRTVIERNPRQREVGWFRIVRSPLSKEERAALKKMHGRIREPEDVARLLSAKALEADNEYVWIIILDAQSQVVGLQEVSAGGRNSSIIDPVMAFRLAIMENASGIIVVHNHPSGDPTPSAEDRAVARELSAAGKIVGVPMYDFAIIAETGFVSFATAGLL